jgi:hypothetical protein
MVLIDDLLDLRVTARASFAGARVLANLANGAQLEPLNHPNYLRLRDLQASAHDFGRTGVAGLTR